MSAIPKYPKSLKPITHLYFHSKILNWKGKEMSQKEFLGSFFQWRIPKSLRYPIMKEMEKMDLISIERKKVYLKDFYFDSKNEKVKIKFKDGDTKLNSPYLDNKEL